MSIFGFGKKKEEKKGGCCCGGACNEQVKKENVNTQKEGRSIKVLGSGCTKCNELEDSVKKALIQLDMDITIDHVTDFSEIASYGVMTTPALVIDGKVVSYGKVLKPEEVVKIIESNMK